jgi:hypothetical protein
MNSIWCAIYGIALWFEQWPTVVGVVAGLAPVGIALFLIFHENASKGSKRTGVVILLFVLLLIAVAIAPPSYCA